MLSAFRFVLPFLAALVVGCGARDEGDTEVASAPFEDQKPAPDGARPCVDSGDCDGRNGVPLCNVDVCVAGFCQVIFDGFGVFCGDPGKGEICDGFGECGVWMPKDASTCYVPEPKAPQCPLCDDGDPATGDGCLPVEEGSDVRVCFNDVQDDGYVCGPGYVVADGKCCPKDILP